VAFCLPAAAADNFPSRPIKMIVVYPAGGGADILARALSDAVQKSTGQPLVVENRPGANGMIGTSACKNSAPDGYTYCMVLSDVLTINPFIYKQVPYNAEKDLLPVSSIANVVGVFTTHKDVPVSNLKELAAYSHAQKGKTNWGTWGVGSSAHLVMTYINKSMGADLVHVPYQGVPQIITALLSKEIDSTMILYGPMAPYIESGRLKPLAVLSDKRLPQLPNVPTAVEQGMNFPSTLWYGVFAPAGVPQATVDRMNAILNKAITDPAVAKTFETQGFIGLGESPSVFAQRIARDRNVWGPLAKSLNLSLD
jgi:tripartite-type tricarboxylate transporter receptor subunit TctC